MINIPTNIWINFSIDILSFVGECFKGQSFRAIDYIILSADCKIRRICGMRQLYTLSEGEYLQGDDSLLPKGFILPNEIKHININFDMDYIKNTIDIKNIKNNNHLIKDKKIYPKTSQSKREAKLINTPNLQHNNNANNNGNKIIRTNIKSKSINKQKIKNNLENDLDKNKNKYNLKEFVEVKKGSLKNLKNINGININKNETMKKEHKNNFFINNKPNKEKINSKSMGKAYLKNKNNIFINGNGKNNFNNNLKNDKNLKKTTDINIKKNNNNNIQQDKNIKRKNINKNINEKKLNNYTNKQQIQKNNKNQVIINNINNKNILIPKEEVNLFNTFNYKDLESKENTLLVNQSNFNNASIPEIVDLDNNNTYLKNIENDINNININNNIIMIDNKNKNNEISIINHDQIDSIYNDKFLNDINSSGNERPYTPPLQKIIPVNNENDATLNNVNITKINESIIQNHYCDLVYDKETGRYFDKKTKIFYDFK